jgi:hypothetical protein
MRLLSRLFTIVALATACAAASAAPPWRQSMQNCWTNVTCDRALIISHGGQWNLSSPYDSLPAFETAFLSGSDSVKGDFRVSKDNIGMVMHSSPIEIYESIPCAGKRVEDLSAAELEKCTMALTNYTFISVPTLLAWAAEKVIVMLCVKESTDIARAISTLIENNATDRAFLEVHVSDLVSLVPTLPGWEQVYFLADADSASDVDATLSAPTLSRIFTFEFEPDLYASQNWTATIDHVLHPAGMRSLTATTKFDPSIAEQEKLFQQVCVECEWYVFDFEPALSSVPCSHFAGN